MKWLNYLKLRNKLIVLVGTPTLGLIIILYGLLKVTSFTNEGVNEFAEKETKTALLIEKLHTQGLQAAQATRNVILNPTDETAKKTIIMPIKILPATLILWIILPQGFQSYQLC